MKMIKRILLFICGALMTSTGFLFLIAEIAIAGGAEVNILPFIEADLIFASILCFIIGGIATMVLAMCGGESL